MKKSTNIATGVFRAAVGVVGFGLLALMIPIIWKEPDVIKVAVTVFLVSLFLGYAFGFEKKMEVILMKVSGINKPKP